MCCRQQLLVIFMMFSWVFLSVILTSIRLLLYSTHDCRIFLAKHSIVTMFFTFIKKMVAANIAAV